MAASATGIATTAKSESRREVRERPLRADSAEAPLAALEVENRLVQLAPARSPARARGDRYSSAYAICHSRKFEIRCSPDVRMSRSGSGQSRGVESRREAPSSSIVRRREACRPATSSRQAARRAHDLGAAAVGDEQVEPRACHCCAVSLDDQRSTAARRRASAGRGRRSRGRARPARASSSASRAMYSSRSDISADISSRRALPVLLREGEERQHLEPRPRSRPRRPRAPPSCRSDARRPRQVPLARPAPVAVHDDGDVPRHRAVRRGSARAVRRSSATGTRAVPRHTSMISASFALINSSILWM